MSNALLNAVRSIRVGNPTGKSVLHFLADMADADGFCFPGEEYIAEALELGPSTVRKWLKILDQQGLIRKIQGGKGRGDRNGFEVVLRRHEVARKDENEDVDVTRHLVAVTRHEVAPKPDLTRHAVAVNPLPGSNAYKKNLSLNQESLERELVTDNAAPPSALPTPATANLKLQKSDRGTRIPDPFMLTPSMRTWAEEEDLSPIVDLNLETKKFVDYYRGVAGQKGLKRDWTATWRNWIRGAFEKLPAYKQQGGHIGTNGKPKPQFGGDKNAKFDAALADIANDPAFGFAERIA
jgi:DNA-binding transcriptional ArsR family regulator